MVTERGQWAARARRPNDDGPSPCDAPAAPGRAHQPVPSAPTLGAAEELLDGVLRRDRVDRADRSPARGRRSRAGAGGSPSASGRWRRPARAAARCGGRGCTAARRGWPPAGRGPGGAPRTVGRRPASVARPKSASWRRGTIQTSNGEREAYGAKATLDVVLPDEPVGPPRFVADEPAERALPLADDEAGRAAQLLGDPVRDLGQVVQVEAQVVGPRAGLGAPVLDDLEVVGLARLAGLGERLAGAADERLDHLVADGVERPVLAGRRDDRPPAARSRAPARARPGRARVSSSRASSPVPTTWNAKSLSIRTRTPSPSGVEQFAQPKRRSSIGSAARANRSRWNARSTTVATHQPVIGSLRSSNRPAATASEPRSSGAPSSRGECRARRWRAARSTDAVVGAAVGLAALGARSRSR